MYHRLFNQLYRPTYSLLTRVSARPIKSFKNVDIVTKITEEYERDLGKLGQLGQQSKASRDERRQRIVKYFYYNPTLTQRLLILKTRFFATGWIYFLCALFSYLGAKFVIWFADYTNKDRYAL